MRLLPIYCLLAFYFCVDFVFCQQQQCQYQNGPLTISWQMDTQQNVYFDVTYTNFTQPSWWIGYSFGGASMFDCLETIIFRYERNGQIKLTNGYVEGYQAPVEFTGNYVQLQQISLSGATMHATFHRPLTDPYQMYSVSIDGCVIWSFAIVGGPINFDDTLANHIVTPVTQQICGIKEYCKNTNLDNISQNNQQQFNPNNNNGINNNNNNGQSLYQPNTNFQSNLYPVSNNNYGIQQQQQYPTFNNINNNNNGQIAQFDATTTSTCTSPYDQPYCYAYVTGFVQSQLQQNPTATAASICVPLLVSSRQNLRIDCCQIIQQYGCLQSGK